MENLHGRKFNTVHIVGAGWYGLHTARLLNGLGLDVVVHESRQSIFKGSSGYNQNRLHLGYHYPRDYKTRVQSRQGFNRFKAEYPNISQPLEKNWYAVHEKSILDFDTYRNIYAFEQYDFSIESPKELNLGRVINTNEEFINPEVALGYFSSLGLNIQLNSLINEVTWNRLKKDSFVIDCTYGGLNFLSYPNHQQRHFLTFIIRNLTSELVFDALTVMDGEFYSIYPYKKNDDLFTLTGVVEGVLSCPKVSAKEVKRRYKALTSKIIKDYPNFEIDFAFEGFFVSRKFLPISNSDRRTTEFYRREGSLSIIGGKIDTIFEIDEYIKNWNI